MLRDLVGNIRKADDRPRSVRFDTDSYQIGIVTFASGCMSPNRDHLITYKASEGKECNDIAAGLKIEVRGTLEFRIDNDDGIIHTITIPNSVHTLDLSMVLV